MYANLTVRIRTESDENSDETLTAWRVSIIGPTATVFLDRPHMGTQKYAEPSGERVVDLTKQAMTIEASF